MSILNRNFNQSQEKGVPLLTVFRSLRVGRHKFRLGLVGSLVLMLAAVASTSTASSATTRIAAWNDIVAAAANEGTANLVTTETPAWQASEQVHFKAAAGLNLAVLASGANGTLGRASAPSRMRTQCRPMCTRTSAPGSSTRIRTGSRPVHDRPAELRELSRGAQVPQPLRRRQARPERRHAQHEPRPAQGLPEDVGRPPQADVEGPHRPSNPAPVATTWLGRS